MTISDTFWLTIAKARRLPSPLSPSADPDDLRKILASRTSDEVAAFGKEFYQALINLNDWSVWGAGYVMTGGMGDDSFHYFRSWLIGKGKEAYETALRAPDELGRFADPEEEEFENESLEYVAVEVLEARGLDDPRESFDVDADSETTGEAWDEDAVFELYPKLAARFA